MTLETLQGGLGRSAAFGAALPGPVLAPSVVFLDLETTGANPATDRITEVAIVKVTDGVLEYQWSTLVDPGVPIPPMIQRFTGITDEMVRGAPTFAAIADELRARLAGSLFAAHNARFDYGFLKNEFRRRGEDFSARVLCTVKLSRALYPGHPRHGLDALIERHGLTCSARHRALGDARVLWDFVQLAGAELGSEAVQAALDKATRPVRLPPEVDPALVDRLPDGAGVYLLYGGEGEEAPLHIGASAGLRARVLSHFAAAGRSGKGSRLAQAVRRIDWRETAGELGAALLEARLARELLPGRRGSGERCTLRRLPQPNRGGALLELVAMDEVDPAALAACHGLFASRKKAQDALREIAIAYRLCARRLGLDAGSGPCFLAAQKRCGGLCTGAESALEHDLRLAGALACLRLRAWPYPGPIAIRETDTWRERHDFHLFHHWCHLGTVRDEAELHEAAAARHELRFDAEVYRLLPGQLERAEAAGRVLRLHPGERSL